MMDYRELRKLKAQLIEKENKTEDELHLLMELFSVFHSTYPHSSQSL